MQWAKFSILQCKKLLFLRITSLIILAWVLSVQTMKQNFNIKNNKWKWINEGSYNQSTTVSISLFSMCKLSLKSLACKVPETNVTSLPSEKQKNKQRDKQESWAQFSIPLNNKSLPICMSQFQLQYFLRKL